MRDSKFHVQITHLLTLVNKFVIHVKFVEKMFHVNVKVMRMKLKLVARGVKNTKIKMKSLPTFMIYLHIIQSIPVQGSMEHRVVISHLNHSGVEFIHVILE